MRYKRQNRGQPFVPLLAEWSLNRIQVMTPSPWTSFALQRFDKIFDHMIILAMTSLKRETDKIELLSLLNTSVRWLWCRPVGKRGHWNETWRRWWRKADWIRERTLLIQHLSSWQEFWWQCWVPTPTGSFTDCFSKPRHPQIPNIVLYPTPYTGNSQNKKFHFFFVICMFFLFIWPINI